MTRAPDFEWIPPMTKIREYVAEHVFDDPRDFVRALRPGCVLWQMDPREWIFRGLPNADWWLLPSAHRPDPWVQFRPHTHHQFMPSAATELERLEREVSLVKLFYEAANYSGLSLPINPVTEDDWQRARLGDWPAPEFIPLLALAQHHGIPTRLLDWTRRAVVAAYFAAQEPTDGKGAVTLCVWALNRRFVEIHGVQDGFACDVHVSSVPHATNANLHAQAGVFTFNNYNGNESGLRAVEFVVSELAQRVDSKLQGVPVMRKLTLPRECAKVLLDELDYEDVSARTLFPGFSGVVDYLRYLKSCP